MRRILAFAVIFSLASIAGANLLTNGGFEDGAEGWNTHSVWWGSGYNWNWGYNSGDAYEGVKALRMTADDGWLAAAQVFDVVPGLRVDLSWALQVADSGENRYEVLLFDAEVTDDDTIGSPLAADIMYKWESGDPNQPSTWTTGSNSRVPTGNKMTVALRAEGNNAATRGDFDALDVVQIPEPTAILLGIGGLLSILRRRRR
jgi:hypothetical protein